MMIRTSRRVASAFVAAASLVAACGGDTPPHSARAEEAPFLEAPRNAGASGSATVTYKPGVHVIEHAAGYNALTSVSTDGSTLVFDRTVGKIPAMKAGDVFVIKGLLARKVVAAKTNGNEIAVLTVPAAITEVVSDAKLHVESPIRFGKAVRVSDRAGAQRSAAFQALGDAIVPRLYAQSPTEERRKAAEAGGRSDAFGNVVSAPYKAIKDGWDTEFSATPADGRLELSLKMKKSLANVSAVITGTGYLDNFDFSSDIDVERSTVERMKVAYRKLNGTMNFKWEVQTTAEGALRGNAKLKLPAAIEIPLYQYLGACRSFSRSVRRY